MADATNRGEELYPCDKCGVLRTREVCLGITHPGWRVERLRAEIETVEVDRGANWERANSLATENRGLRDEVERLRADIENMTPTVDAYARAVGAMCDVLQPGGRLAGLGASIFGQSITEKGPGILADEVERLLAKIEAALAVAKDALHRIQFAPEQERETVEFVVGLMVKALKGEEGK